MTSLSSDQANISQPEEPEYAPIPKTLIAAVVLTLATWLYLFAFAKFDPMLWYLNWSTGMFSLYSHLSSGFVYMVLIVAILNVFGYLMFPSPTLATIAVVTCCMVFTLSNDGLVRRIVSSSDLIARTECYQPSSRECLLNDYAKMYDLGWTRAMTPKEREQYVGYVALRERAKLMKPNGEFTAYQLGRHQARLKKWEVLFKSELDSILKAT